MERRWRLLLLLATLAFIGAFEYRRVLIVCSRPASVSCQNIPWRPRSAFSAPTAPPSSPTSLPAGYTTFSSDLNEPHPIHRLIREAQEKWQKKLDRQSSSLEEAVLEYRRRYSRPPPKGFDLWYNFARRNKVQLLDDYDTIHRQILPFASLPSAVLRQRLALLREFPGDWVGGPVGTITVKDGKVDFSEEVWNLDYQSDLIEAFAEHLPDMEIVSSSIKAHDEPNVLVSGTAMQRHLDAARAGRYVDEAHTMDLGDELSADGLLVACLPTSAIRNTSSISPLVIPTHLTLPTPQFVESPRIAGDVCAHPTQRHLHGTTSAASLQPNVLFPHFSMSSASPWADLLFPPMYLYDDDGEEGDDSPWEEKPYSKLVWRGRGTGASYTHNPLAVKYSQRIRLAKVPTQTGTIDLHLALSDSASAPGPLTLVSVNASTLAHEIFDIRLTGPPYSCGYSCHKLKDGIEWDGPVLSFEEQNRFKFIMDVDGNGWSARFHRLMGTNAAVLKSTIYNEWYEERIQPWLHFVPIALDYSDLWEVLAFFRGDVSGKSLHTSPTPIVCRGAHDALAEQIGRQGKEWRDEFWRYEDMQAYLFRLLLEYARVMNVDPEDRSSMDYKAAG
ncbi:hypothetical protein RQP46_003726 [Phenoliferia psychrophenolica]